MKNSPSKTNSASASASAAPSEVPSLDEMAGDWIPALTTANPPAVHNFHNMLVVNSDLTSFLCYPDDSLWDGKSRKLRMGCPPVRMTVDGGEYSASDYRWYPYRALRRNPDCAGLAVETDTRMINQQSAVLVRVRVINPGKTARKAELALGIPGQLRPEGVSVINTSHREGFVSVIRPARKPDVVTSDDGVIRWRWSVVIPAGGEQAMEFAAGAGRVEDAEKVIADVAEWSAHFAVEFDGFKKCWKRRWADAFTPGNRHFSGSLPVLVSDNAALRRNYYMGAVTMLALERTQFPVHPRSFITSGERLPGTQYYWDASMQATAWALLEPEGMKTTLRRWLVQNVRWDPVIMITETKGFDNTKYGAIAGYAFNACAIFQTAFDYLRITGDRVFLDEKLENGETVLARLDEIAVDWKTLVLPDSPLANYGENANLLECAPAYIHRVASANAQNVLLMREAAALHELKGNATRAKELRDDADKFVPTVLGLYKPGEGVWHGLHKDGTRVELRHCVDYIYVGNALAPDLTPAMRREMTDFVKHELFMRDWMRAMSLKDAAAAHSDRPDHGPMGAYDGWIPLTVGAMWRLGFPRDAFEFYCRTAAVTKEGPFAQAREFYGPNRDQYDAPVRVSERQGCFKESISGVAFTDVVINTFFGFMPPLDGKTTLVDPDTSRPFTGKLIHVRNRGVLATIIGDEKGVRIEKESVKLK